MSGRSANSFLAVFSQFYNLITYAEMVERSITAVLKTVDGNIRGFESLSLRHHSLGILSEFQGFFFAFMRRANFRLLSRFLTYSCGRRDCKCLPSYSYPSAQASPESSSSVLCLQGARTRRNVANRGIEFVSIRFSQE